MGSLCDMCRLGKYHVLFFLHFGDIFVAAVHSLADKQVRIRRKFFKLRKIFGVGDIGYFQRGTCSAAYLIGGEASAVNGAFSAVMKLIPKVSGEYSAYVPLRDRI